jgi:hypothetical protein
MKGDYRVDVARPGEEGEVARLVRCSLAPQLRRLTIWESPRVDRFVAAILGGAFPDEAREFFLLRWEDQPAGVAAFRLLAGRAFLNHLYVGPWLRGRLLGLRLFAASARSYLSRHGWATLALDVVAGQQPAEAWYERLGFVESERRQWWLEDQTSGRQGNHRRWRELCDGLAEAERQHRIWGFSSLTASAGDGQRYQVGRLYTPYFRLTQAAAAQDRELGAVLTSLDSTRRLLLLAPQEMERRVWRKVALSRRLECEARVLLERLEGRLPVASVA